jgi:hypothetical protein
MRQDGSDRALVTDRNRRLSHYAWALAPPPEFPIGGSARSWRVARPLLPRNPAAVVLQP